MGPLVSVSMDTLLSLFKSDRYSYEMMIVTSGVNTVVVRIQ